MRFLIIISMFISFIYAKSDEAYSIDVTLLGRYLSNKSFNNNAPYSFALIESDYQGNNYTVYGGFGFKSKKKNKELFVNHIYLSYFTENYTFKIGKMVQKVGVLDYFSLIDTLNPVRAEFFDDSKAEIKKTPLWMSSIEYYVNDYVVISGFVEPFDSKHLDYTNSYIQYMLSQFIPAYFKDEFNQELIGSKIIYPLYTNSLVPYVEENIAVKYSSSSIDLNKLTFGFVLEYSDDRKKVGVLYFNKYSEVPLITVDQNLLDAAIKYKNGESPFQDLANYIESDDYDLLKSVKGFRYQQFGLYGESTLGEYGIRAEFSYRDKVPLLNEFGSLTSIGFAIDHFSASAYNVLETQFIHLGKYKKNAYISMFRTQFEKNYLWKLSWYVGNSFIGTKVDDFEEYSIAPKLTFGYKQVDLTIEGLFSKNNTQANTISMLLRAKF